VQNISGLETSVADLDTRVTQNISGLETSVADLDTRLVQNVNALETSVADLDTRLVQNISGLETSVADLDTRLVQNISGLETSVADLDTRLVQNISGLETSVADLDTQVVQKQNIIGKNTVLTTGDITTHGQIRINAIDEGSFSDGLMTTTNPDGKITFGPPNGNTLIAIQSLGGAIVASKFIALSDHRAKEQIMPLPIRSGIVQKMNPVSYKYKNATDRTDHIGFIAQDLEKIDKRFVTRQRGRLPNIMQKCDVRGGVIFISDENIRVGAVLEIHFAGSIIESTVTHIDEKYVTVNKTIGDGQCIVLGTIEDDILAVDFIAIIAELVNEIQEHKRVLDSLNARI